MKSLTPTTKTVIYKSPQGNREIHLNLIYVDKFGNDYWSFEKLEDIPARRMVEASKAERHFDFNLTRTQLVQMLNQIISSADTNQKNAIAQEIIQRTYFCGELETTIDIACCYFLINDESINEWSYVMQGKKREAWLGDGKTHEGDPAALAFFLAGAHQFIAHLVDLSKDDFQQLMLDNIQGRKVRIAKSQQQESKKKEEEENSTFNYAQSSLQKNS